MDATHSIDELQAPAGPGPAAVDGHLGDDTGGVGAGQETSAVSGGLAPEGSGPDPLQGLALSLEVHKLTPASWRVTARAGADDRVVHVDTFNPARASGRHRFARAVVKAMNIPADLAEEVKQAIEAQLLQKISESEILEAESPQGVEYDARDDPDRPAETGYYARSEFGERRLTNFVVRLDEERRIGDVDDEVRTTEFRGKIYCRGEVRDYAVTSGEFSDRLPSTIFKAAGAKAELLGRAEEIRTAISRNSRMEVRDVTTSLGWTADNRRFLFPGGHVDEDGCRDHVADCGVPEVQLPRGEIAGGVRLLRLSPERLADLKRHVAEDLLRLHTREVMLSLLGSAALAVTVRSAGLESRPLVWLQGLTGAGKSFAARLAQCLFGDFRGDRGGQVASWISTGNSLQADGFLFRDCLYLIDDYKPENTPHNQAVRLLQAYADGAARGRLNADGNRKLSRPIRGLLLSTGEDFVAQDASGRARAIVIPVPTVEQDAALGRACYDRAGEYPALTADLIAFIIRGDHLAGFAGRVVRWQDVYRAAIGDRPNAGRIAGNHAALAAAVELLGEYLGDAWPGAAPATSAYCGEYLRDRAVEAAGAVREDLPGQIFVDTLRDLFEFGRVRIQQERSRYEPKSPVPVIGRVITPPAGSTHPNRGRPSSSERATFGGGT